MTVRCRLCGKPINPNARDTRQRVEGWGRRSHVRASGAHGGSDIELREYVNGFAHGRCIALVKAGVNPNQEVLA
jgi:hypothetical protein